jgi:DNA adenine methylase
MKNCCVFRYPGGKLKLGKEIIKHIPRIAPSIKNDSTFAYVEPFVGGGGMLINIAHEYRNAKLFINDLDLNIASFWITVTHKNPQYVKELQERLLRIPTVDYFFALRNVQPETLVDRAYYAVFFNKTTFSGIATAGPIGGKNQTGKWKIDCYYKPDLLNKRIDNLRAILVGRTHVTSLPVLEYLEKIRYCTNQFIYLDPPYYEEGSKLYPVFMTDEEHRKMALSLKNMKNWLLSYDICPTITDMYSWANFCDIEMTRHINVGNDTDSDGNKFCKKAKEYLIFPKEEKEEVRVKGFIEDSFLQFLPYVIFDLEAHNSGFDSYDLFFTQKDKRGVKIGHKVHIEVESTVEETSNIRMLSTFEEMKKGQGETSWRNFTIPFRKVEQNRRGRKPEWDLFIKMNRELTIFWATEREYFMRHRYFEERGNPYETMAYDNKMFYALHYNRFEEIFEEPDVFDPIFQGDALIYNDRRHLVNLIVKLTAIPKKERELYAYLRKENATR